MLNINDLRVHSHKISLVLIQTKFFTTEEFQLQMNTKSFHKVHTLGHVKLIN